MTQHEYRVILETNYLNRKSTRVEFLLLGRTTDFKETLSWKIYREITNYFPKNIQTLIDKTTLLTNSEGLDFVLNIEPNTLTIHFPVTNPSDSLPELILLLKENKQKPQFIVDLTIMEQIRIYDTHTQYETELSTLIKPNVSFCIDQDHIHFIPKPYDYSLDYLTFEALEDGTFTLTIGSKVTTSMLESISYSLDNGKTWIDTSNVDSQEVVVTTPTITLGNTVLWKGTGTTMSKATTTTVAADRPTSSSIFSSTGRFNAYGNIMSLLNGDNYINNSEFANGSTSNFALLFYCSNMPQTAKLVSIENLVFSANNMTNYCCVRMFLSCTTLTDTPQLLATTLANYCYSQMFYMCESLTTINVISATTLKDYCCLYMFYGCTSLTTVPVLPATTLASNCYTYMFRDCTSLTTAPVLPATTLAYSCYSNMFQGCTNLTTVPELPATTLAQSCYQSMFTNCTSLEKAPKILATTLEILCFLSMFDGCTSLTVIYPLSATTLASGCCRYMFKGCTSLTTVPELPSAALVSECYYGMFRGCSGLTTAPELPATVLKNSCYWEMFAGCKSLTTAPELPATTLVSDCYRSMFSGCTNLSYIKAMFTTTPNNSYTRDWVNNVASTGTFVKNSSATWDVTGTNGIPTGWTVETASA